MVKVSTYYHLPERTVVRRTTFDEEAWKIFESFFLDSDGKKFDMKLEDDTLTIKKNHETGKL